jgi:hypothetical protein
MLGKKKSVKVQCNILKGIIKKVQLQRKENFFENGDTLY